MIGDKPEENPLYSAYDQATSPNREQREQAALQKAVERGRLNPEQEKAALMARVAALEAKLAKLQGRGGITVNLPIISFDPTKLAGGTLTLDSLPKRTLDISFAGDVYEADVVILAVRLVTE